MSTIKITSENFHEEVLSCTKPVLVDFWADWCGPCRMLSPVIETIATENTDIKVCKVNIEEQPELAEHFGILSIPTLLVFHKGKVLKQAVGTKTKEEILEMLPEN